MGVGASNPFENGGGDPDLPGDGVSLVPNDPSGRCRVDGLPFYCARMGALFRMDSVLLAPVESFRALRFRDSENRVRGVLGRYDAATGAYLPVGVTGLHGGVAGDAVVYNFRFGDGAAALGFAAYNPPGGGSPIAPQNTSPPIDVPAIRSEIERRLEDPACDTFIKYLLAEVSGRRPDTLMEAGDVLKIFDRINTPWYGGRGMVRDGQPGSHELSGALAIGSFSRGTAQIQLGIYNTGVTSAEQVRLGDGRMALDETMHHAGLSVYYDYDYALAISKLPGMPPLPDVPEKDRYGAGRYKFSNYWHPKLHEICK